MRIEGIRLLSKTGGKSGDYTAPGRNGELIMALMTVAEAKARILEGVEPLPGESVSIYEANGRVLAEAR